MASKPKSDAQAAYEAWADAHGWTSPFGTVLTAWQCLSIAEQQIWKCVAEAAIKNLFSEPGEDRTNMSRGSGDESHEPEKNVREPGPWGEILLGSVAEVMRPDELLVISPKDRVISLADIDMASHSVPERLKSRIVFLRHCEFSLLSFKNHEHLPALQVISEMTMGRTPKPGSLALDPSPSTPDSSGAPS